MSPPPPPPDTRAELRLSWHRSVRRESARDPAAAGIPQLQTAYVPTTLAEEPDLAAACDDTAAGDRLPTLPNCPIPFGFFLSGGAGQLTDAVGDRPTASADVAHRLGRHVVRAGGTVEDSRVVQTARFTGGDLQRSVFQGVVERQRFYAGSCGADPGTPCNYTDESELAYRTRYAAAYLEDTIELAPNLRVDAGLRWELMWVGPYLHLSRQLAPRFGLAWDVLGGGTSRLFATLGRSFVMLNPGLGPTLIARPTSVRDLGGVLGEARRLDEGGVIPVADGIRPAAQDEATAGFEIGRLRTARAAVWVQARTLRRGYETVIDDPEAFTLRFDNPGRDGDTPASRASTTLAIEVSTDPAARTVARAGYLYGRTTGTWAGPVDPRQGVHLYTSSDWNGDTWNYDGRLPTDAGHRAFVEGERRGRLGAVDLGVALRLSVASGRPRNVLAETDRGVVHLVPRGSAGRGPMVSQANVRVAARWRGTDLTLDVFNAFDRETATNFDEIYAGGTVQPIRGGREADLIFLKDATGAPAVRRSAFRLPSAFQSPIAATLGIHRAF